MFRSIVILSTLFITIVLGPNVKAEPMPVDFKVAFVGDMGAHKGSLKLLQLMKDEEVQLVLHLGDLDYNDDPVGFDKRITEYFGEDFPYLVLEGNHDRASWLGPYGHQALQIKRLKRAGVAFSGDAGVMSSINYKGLFIVMVSPGINGWDLFSDAHAEFIRDQLAASSSPWRICAWHKNQKKMQTAKKRDETYWGVYEECRLGGAMIGTGHSHTYSRSHLFSDIREQKVASESSELILEKGSTFVFVSGLGGGDGGPGNISKQRRKPADPWWASIYTATQGAVEGALFCEFNKGGKPDKASCYFKNIRGEVIDNFTITSRVK